MGPDGAIGKLHAFNLVGSSAEYILEGQPVIAACNLEDKTSRTLSYNFDIRCGNSSAKFDAVDASGIGDDILAVAEAVAVNIVARIACQSVVAGATCQNVIADIACQAVVATITRNAIIAAICVDDVVACAAGNAVRRRCTVNNVIAIARYHRTQKQIGMRQPATVGEHELFYDICSYILRANKGNSILRSCNNDQKSGIADLPHAYVRCRNSRTKFDTVHARRIGDSVLAIAQIEAIDIISSGTRQRIGARATNNDVVAQIACKVIVAGIARQNVVPAERIDYIIAGSA